MIVPQYWAEARRQHRASGRQVTVRRFGWSDISPEDAQAQAESRADDALAQILSGVKLPRREPRTAYNGAVGVPIREAIVARYDEVIITRNAYGARCLNTPNVFFADIDYQLKPSFRQSCIIFVACVAVAALLTWYVGHIGILVTALLAAVVLWLVISRCLFAWQQLVGGGPEKIARRRVEQFIGRHPEWHVRLYRTPAGLRILAMHQTFDPADPVTQEVFQELGTDPIYALMCANQRCFRARVSPKPWRVGIESHIRPRRATWPFPPERMVQYNRWIENYEGVARDFAACVYVDSLGSTATDPAAELVRELHDELCRATSALPIA